jgi:hypothetical protein
MKSPVSASDARALAIGSILVVPMLVFKLAALPFAGHWMERDELIAAQRGLYEREVRAIEDSAGNMKRKKLLAGQLSYGYRRLFVSDEPNLASAAVLSYVDSLAEANRVLLAESNLQKADSVSREVSSVKVEIAGGSDFEGLLRFLSSIERGPRLAHVRALAITAPAVESDPNGVQSLGFKATLELFFVAPAIASQGANL